jgi:hypothetical protein
VHAELVSLRHSTTLTECMEAASTASDDDMHITMARSGVSFVLRSIIRLRYQYE